MKYTDRRFLDARPATPWCKDNFTATEMREIRSAATNAKPAGREPNYAPHINIFTPFKALIINVRDAKGKAVEYKTTLWRFYDLLTKHG